MTTISEASLEKVIEINELATVDYTYNAIATAYAEDNETVKYNVAYEGVVNAGIDFKQIDIQLNAEENIIKITLPSVARWIIFSQKTNMKPKRFRKKH